MIHQPSAPTVSGALPRDIDPSDRNLSTNGIRVNGGMAAEPQCQACPGLAR
jgi:hypothetical protein